MALTLSSLSPPPWAGFDTIIDVRSPAEYAEDHIPGAISCPVLSNEERARVGTIYKQDSPFAARKIGAALVARNAASHIEDRLMGFDGGWQPLVYCWRGGQRSGSFATILRQIGWRAEVVEGGYRAYRRLVVEALYHRPLPLRLLRIDGYTGTGKTALLQDLAAQGAQVIDLEDLAAHRGSTLGARPAAQPSQKLFESRLSAALAACDPQKPLLLEAESARIGALRLPPALWQAMRASPRIVIEAPLAVRARFLAQAYDDLCADPDAFCARLLALTPYQGAKRVAQWQGMIKGGDWDALAGELMQYHYDPAYARLRTGDQSPEYLRLATDDLGPEARAKLARAIMAELPRLSA